MKNKMQILIETALVQSSVKKVDLARALGISQSNFHGRLSRGRFTYDELETMAKAMGCELEVTFKPVQASVSNDTELA